MKIFAYVELTILEYVLFVVTNRSFMGSKAVESGLLLEIYSILTGEQSVMLWENENFIF